jgi:phosphate transport system substrate-binding protein
MVAAVYRERTQMNNGTSAGRIARLVLYAAPIGLAALGAYVYFGGGADSAPPQTGSVQIVGSETMRPVVTACAEEFMARNPKSDIIVKGGGSSDGITALLHGIADIGMASRNLSKRERDYAASKAIEISEAAFARDGITLVVNRTNSVTTLDLAQIRSVFTGEIRNWREVGGADAEVQLYARAAGSGTATLFGEHVLGGNSYAGSVRYLPSNEAIVQEVAKQPGAIGYTSLGALRNAGDRISVVALGTTQSAIAPTPEAVRSGQYPLTRTLHLNAAGKPSGIVKAFVEFCAGAGGQALVQRAGYVSTGTVGP